jgi:hypothetical protein
MHRLMDDIADLERVNAALKKARGKTVISCLRLKQKIKELMVTEGPPPAETNDSSEFSQQERKRIIGECCNRVFNTAYAQEPEEEKPKDQACIPLHPDTVSAQGRSAKHSSGTDSSEEDVDSCFPASPKAGVQASAARASPHSSPQCRAKKGERYS